MQVISLRLNDFCGLLLSRIKERVVKQYRLETDALIETSTETLGEMIEEDNGTAMTRLLQILAAIHEEHCKNVKEKGLTSVDGL
ncbi:hypothetical protein E3N88_27529 [Mikania micrantha]|uniref:Uncharacterized protein n=1 Tax=Mikania micrantha TaxID=192012 RepID=A0A5N6MX16_9ASTR|nr:hypothetical protein E3N88_27529 [Mikania micrantha]